MLLYIRALTSLHVGTGRSEGGYVDLPVQRDEFNFPTIWASSLKGALKANIRDGNLKELLGSEPEETPSKPSAISLLDAKLLLMPVRVLDGVWSYATSPHLLQYLNKYLEVHSAVTGARLGLLNLNILDLGKVYSTKFSGDVIINEVMFRGVVRKDDLLTELGLDKLLPDEVRTNVLERGLIILPDKDNLGLVTLSKSLVIQYRVRLKGETKTVETGPWSEEYVPMETLFISAILCRDSKSSTQQGSTCKEFIKYVDKRVIYVGGKETIGKGLVKLYTFS
jgi:CRISPR-associated protein Cmr4